MPQATPATLIVTVCSTNEAVAHEFQEKLHPQLERFKLFCTFVHTLGEVPFSCTARLSAAATGEIEFQSLNSTPAEALLRLPQWLESAGAAATPSEESQEASCLEEQVVLQRLTDLGYL